MHMDATRSQSVSAEIWNKHHQTVAHSSGYDNLSRYFDKYPAVNSENCFPTLVYSTILIQVVIF
jgi:hypothetical protein